MREANVKRLHTVWFQHFDILETLWRQEKHQWLRGGMEVVFRWWNHSAWYSQGGYRTLCICQNPQNIQHKEGTRRKLWSLVKNDESILIHQFNKCTILMQDINRANSAVQSKGNSGNFVFLRNFFVNLRVF